MEDKKILEIKYQLIQIAEGFNGYNGAVLVEGIKTRLEMSGAIDKPIESNPQTGDITPQDAEKLLFLATDIFKNTRLKR
jgi:hypothetical protein